MSFFASRSNNGLAREISKLASQMTRSMGYGSGEWQFNATITAPPAAGQIRTNNANPTLATHVFLSNITAPGVDVTTLLTALLAVGQRLYVQDIDDASRYVIYAISAITPQTGYKDLTVTVASSNGALAAQRMLVSLLPA